MTADSAEALAWFPYPLIAKSCCWLFSWIRVQEAEYAASFSEGEVAFDRRPLQIPWRSQAAISRRQCRYRPVVVPSTGGPAPPARIRQR